MQVLPVPKVLVRMLDCLRAVSIPKPRSRIVLALSPASARMQRLLKAFHNTRRLDKGGRPVAVPPVAWCRSVFVGCSCAAVATADRKGASAAASRRGCAAWTAAALPATVLAVVSESRAAGGTEVENFWRWLPCWFDVWWQTRSHAGTSVRRRDTDCPCAEFSTKLGTFREEEMFSRAVYHIASVHVGSTIVKLVCVDDDATGNTTI